MNSLFEKRLTKLQKVLALAARRKENEQEAKAAAARLFELLAVAPALPLRYHVKSGVQIRVMPSAAIGKPQALTSVRVVESRRNNIFFERHRVRSDRGRDAMHDSGLIMFDRHGYTLFIFLADMEMFL